MNLLAALTQPALKANSIEDEVKKNEARIKLKQFVHDAVTPIAEQSSSSTTDGSFNFMPDNSALTNDEDDRYFKDTDTNIEI